jgi:hypothetical protein
MKYATGAAFAAPVFYPKACHIKENNSKNILR